jgi:hypothetical protein
MLHIPLLLKLRLRRYLCGLLHWKGLLLWGGLVLLLLVSLLLLWTRH